jgi:hypothetical protein
MLILTKEIDYNNNKIRVHSGKNNYLLINIFIINIILGIYNNLFKHKEKLIKSLLKIEKIENNIQIYFTGHSLGIKKK